LPERRKESSQIALRGLKVHISNEKTLHAVSPNCSAENAFPSAVLAREPAKIPVPKAANGWL